MRIWDVAAGYLSRQSLLGEHRELHGLYSILLFDKKGYSRHPETLRWVGCVAGLVRRHDLLAAEMHLRGYRDRTPLRTDAGGRVRWPSLFVSEPMQQYSLLESKYGTANSGRIPLPRSTHELWAQHKYSVLARDPARYREIGRLSARLRGLAGFGELSEELVTILRQAPSRRTLPNAVEHMWGYVSRDASAAERRRARQSVGTLLRATQELALRERQPYLLASTALSELAIHAVRGRLLTIEAGLMVRPE
jgi:hypothetical protein